MQKIIQFPIERVKNTNGYNNLKQLFEVCDTLESCNLYLESVEQLYSKGSIIENEMHTLRRIGRQKRLKLAEPEKTAPIKAEAPGTYSYTPEMGQQKPIGCQMEAGLSYGGGHYWVDTPLELKGRGIRQNETHWVNGSRKQLENWKSYTVTRKAFEKLREMYAISMEMCLD